VGNSGLNRQNSEYSGFLKSQPMPRAVILTALPVEYWAVRAHLTDLREETHLQGTVYERGKFAGNGQEWEVGIAEIDAGNVGATVEVEWATAHFQPNILFSVGIAGGIKNVKTGDVVAATKVYSYKLGNSHVSPVRMVESNYALVQRAKSEARKADWLQRLSNHPVVQPHVFVAPIVSVDRIIKSSESDDFQFLSVSCAEAIAVDMEGFCFLNAAKIYPNVQSIVIRGISGVIGEKDNSLELKQTPQEKAACFASAFTFEMLSKLCVEEPASMTISQDNQPLERTRQGTSCKDVTERQNREHYCGVKDMHQDDSIDVVIVTALEKERDAVLRYLDSPQTVESKNRVVYKSYLQHETSSSGYNILLLCLGGMGNVQAATAVTQAIDVWNPAAIVLVGIMGGVEGSDRLLGDLIIAEQIVGYELGKIKETETERRFEALRPAHLLVEKARHFPPQKWMLDSRILPRPDGTSGRVIPKVHFGIVVSGEKVIADTITVPELQSSWVKLIGVEMESFGTALAVYQSDSAPAMLMVKSICDWADPKKNDEWQAYAADIAAAYVVNFLKSKPIDYRGDNRVQTKLAPSFSGKAKIELCRRLGKDWLDLADYFEIPEYQRSRFDQGRECQGIWEWLRERNQLYSLHDALINIDRQDLVELLGTKN
jgi:nucleoside phosphorylase